MENHDKIYEQIKDASRKAEEKPFPAMDKVWSRVEDKLDAKALEKQNSRWKKIAVAASILLVASLGYQLLKPQQDFKENRIEKSTEVTLAPQSPSEPNAEIDIQQNASTTENPAIKKNAGQILQRQIAAPQPVAVADEAVQMSAPAGNAEVVEMKEKEVLKKKEAFLNTSSSKTEPSAWRKGKIYEAKSANNDGLYNKDDAKDANPVYFKKPQAEEVQKNINPLYVINGEAADKNRGESAKAELSKLDPDDIESIEVLKEPLYIIDGKYYSEEELFGANPTSPYAPLDQQEIKTVKILKGDEATSAYGKKGEKGVVIITTKNKKPAAVKGK